MLLKYLRNMYNLPDKMDLKFDNLSSHNPDIPRIFFTHDSFLKYYKSTSKTPYYNKSVIMLVRDPRDVAVSAYHHIKFRRAQENIKWKNYDSDKPIFDAVYRTLCVVIDFMNEWASESSHIKKFMLLRYENMKNQPADCLEKILQFMEIPVSKSKIIDAVEYASYENMKRMEKNEIFKSDGNRLMAIDKTNPDSYKVRRAKIGGYRDYFNEEEIVELDRQVNERLSPFFGYSSDR